MTKASGALPEDDLLYAPGLKWRMRIGRQVPYWIPPANDIKAGYQPKNLALDPEASQLELAAACRQQWEDLKTWRKPRALQPANHTFAWLIDRFENDEHSPFQRVKVKTQDDYRGMNRIIRAAIGERRIDPKREGGISVPRISGDDFRRWHANFGRPVPLLDDEDQPVKDSRGKAVMVPSAPARARAAVTQVRMLIKYGRTILVPGIKDLCDMLHEMRFPTPAPRNTAPTRDQVDAIVKQAEKDGDLSIAITTLAQYELTERRIHIIGEWVGDEWRGGWEWRNYKDGVIGYVQAKRETVERVFDLKMIPALYRLVESIPQNMRFGAMIKREATGKPWQRYDYAKRFRVVATAAGVPKTVWSMDMRAGGATEADDIAAITPRMLQDGLGHANLSTQERYRRGKVRNAQKVVELRQAAKRTSGE